jgi:hypothetical protein
VKNIDVSLAGGWIEVASIVHPPGEVVVSIRLVAMLSSGSLQAPLASGGSRKVLACLESSWYFHIRKVVSR